MRVHRIVHPTKHFVSRKTRDCRLIGFLRSLGIKDGRREAKEKPRKTKLLEGSRRSVLEVRDAPRAPKINVSTCRGRKSSGDLSGKLKNFPTGIPNLSYPRSAKWL